MFNVPAFRAYMKTLIGDMTQMEFAARKGITPEHLSRMMRSEKPSRPAKSTLKKIAGDSEGTYKELLSLCGYADEENRVVLETQEDMIEKRLEELRGSFREMTKGVHVYSDLESFLEEYRLLYDSKNVTFSIGKKLEYDEGDHYLAEYIVPVSASYPLRGCECRIYAALFFSETKGGKVVVLDTAMDGRSLLRAGIMTEEDGRERFEKLSFVYVLKNDYSAEKRLLKALFGDRTDEQVTMTRIGFGVSFPDSFLTDGLVKDFLKKHDAGKYKNAFADRILAGEPASMVLEDYDTNMDIGDGAGCLIAEIMREETGIDFIYCEDVTEEPEARSAVMLPRNLYSTCDIDELKEASCRMAKDLGIREYGECIVYTRDYIDSGMRFTTEE